MRLLLMLPLLALLAVSGFNLSAGSNNLAVIALHLIVMVICIAVIAMIVKSIFRIKYIEMPEKESEQAYESLDLQHS
ncbi:hypothetical protein [uncultured Flavobacterium sp.]|uniref:hypothetical protein n=1 Tax=uncultured Flavobacterium sp. TaxID=165435 RepID=UPI0025EC5B89|nr:hypothetical protein [uncultured Flavobacterium sp.]